MEFKVITKRDGSTKPFDLVKISKAVFAAMQAVGHGEYADAEVISKKVDADLDKLNNEEVPLTVEKIQDIVEEKLMASDFHDVAKAYILYREKRAQERKRDIFKKRVSLKPYEYPELIAYVDAIRFSYWIHTEFNFTGDVQDFKVNVNEVERNAIKNAMLAIAQIEVSVKTFWGDIYKKMPKPEIGAVGFTFAESEVRHQDAYAHLIEILGLNHEFENIQKVPAIVDRIATLEKATAGAHSEDNREYAQSILLFSLFIEHVSLFSQFLIIMSFNKFRDLFKGMSNAIEATSKEEQIHGLFGIELINIIQQEHPEWFDHTYKERIRWACKETYDAESRVLDWILEKGELEFLPKEVIQQFIKNRLNNSLKSIGIEPVFEIDDELVQQTDWFDDEIIATKHGDFFVKRSTNYNKRSQSITGDDLF